MIDLVLNITDFRAQFPAFSSLSSFPDSMLQMYFDVASNYVSTIDYGILKGSSRLLALYLMTAHLLQNSLSINNGGTGKVITSTSDNGTSVSLQPPPSKNMLQFWLSQTPYGLQLYGLLSVKSVGGFYVGGSLAKDNIRQYDGSFK